MSFENTLNSLTPEQRDIVVKLPYRAGLFISESDNSGGDSANDDERRTLENIIYGFADGVFGSELIQYIMSEIINRRAEWGQWDQNLDNVLQEAHDAMEILSAYVDQKECSAFTVRIMEIAEAVALAFREQENLTHIEHLRLYLSYLSHRARARALKMPYRNFNDFLSISPAERVALSQMAQALKTQYI